MKINFTVINMGTLGKVKFRQHLISYVIRAFLIGVNPLNIHEGW